MPALSFEISTTDPSTHARVGKVTTPHGSFDTPAFMPVGTQGTVKGLTPDQVRDSGAQIILGNTYHLMLRPGSAQVASQGGLQQWTRWQGPMLTDSGGFQVFSLADLNKINDDGVRFKSHLDGSLIDLTPERSMRVQHELGADIIMAFDDCPPAGDSFEGDASAYGERVRVANERTLRWLERCVKEHRGSGRDAEQALFPIVQGGTDLDQRAWCVERVCEHETPGYAIGGVAVGEPPELIHRVVGHTAPLLPSDKPRYLMGVGYERDIVRAVRAGVDMFDCVLPTRNGRKGSAFTPRGVVKLRNALHKADPRPIDEGCDCVACAGGFSRSYLQHLFRAGEMLGANLVSLHNLRHFQRLMLDIRHAIAHNGWSLLARDWPVLQLDAMPG
jgi:queuine tRNA-ribosyltransferase